MTPSFLTHYYEAERGPFKNICDLSGDELDGLILWRKTRILRSIGLRSEESPKGAKSEELFPTT